MLPERFDLSRLPSLPPVLLRLLCAFNDEHVSPRQVAALIDADIGLSARVVAAANASCFGPPRQYRGVEQTVVHLGLRAIRAIAVTASVQSVFESRPDAPAAAFLRACWLRSLRAAFAARQLARLIGQPETEEAYVVALLQDLGRLLMTLQDPAYPQWQQDTQDLDGLLAAERAAFGITHHELVARLLQEWRFPTLAAAAPLQRYRAPAELVGAQPLSGILRLANLLADGGPADEAAGAGQQLFGLARELLQQVQGQAIREAAALAQTLRPAGRGEEADAALSARIGAELGRLALFDQARLELAEAAELPALQAALVQAACRLFDVPAAALLLRRDEQTLASVAAWPPFRAEDCAGLPVPLAGAAALSAAARRGEVIDSATTHALLDEQFASLLAQPQLLCVPLAATPPVPGLLAFAVDAPAAARLQPRHAALQLFAEEAAAAIERLQRAQALAEQARREAAELPHARARVMVHEAANPLGIMRNYLGILGLRLGEEHAVQGDLRIIGEEIDRVAAILRQYADSSAPVTDDGTPVEVDRLLREQAGLLRLALFEPHDCRLETDLSAGLNAAPGSGPALKQIVLNLLRNAVEALGSGGTVQLSSAGPVWADGGEFIEISVSDDGPGLPPEVQRRLFQPLTSHKGDGHAGLGLSIVANLVRELGGRIDCRSRPQRGCEFHVRVPRHAVADEV